jgi:hypothetical protein
MKWREEFGVLPGWGKYMTGVFESEADRLNWCHQVEGEVHDTTT